MKTLLRKQVTLRPFPSASVMESSEIPPNTAIQVHVEIQESLLKLEYYYSGDLHGVVLPPPTQNSPERLDQLWEQTCLEAFISWKDTPEYWELNLSPNGNWNFYHFDDYRKGRKSENRISTIQSEMGSHRSERTLADAKLDLSPIFQKSLLSPDLILGITAVLELQTAKGKIKTYWALTHCGRKPDFHLRESFILKPMA